MSQWHNQISNTILEMRSSLSRHLPGYIAQNNTILEAEESRCPAHPMQAHAIPSYVNPHCRERGVNGAEIPAQLSPLSLPPSPGPWMPASSSLAGAKTRGLADTAA